MPVQDATIIGPPLILACLPEPSCRSIPLVTVLSLIHWSESVPVDPAIAAGTPDSAFTIAAAIAAAAVQPGGGAAAATAPEAGQAAMAATIRPNHDALQWMLLAQIIFPLCIYALALFICIRRSFRPPRILVITVCVSMAWSIMAVVLIHHYDFAFW